TSLRAFADLVCDEVNVKSVEFTDDVAAYGRLEIAVNARAAGPRIGKDVQAVIKAVKSGEWTTTAEGSVVAAGVELLEGEYERKLVAAGDGAAAELGHGRSAEHTSELLSR